MHLNYYTGLLSTTSAGENVTKYGLINSWVTLLPTVTHCLWFGSEACEGRALPSQQKFVYVKISTIEAMQNIRNIVIHGRIIHFQWNSKIVKNHQNLPHFGLANPYLRGMEDKTSPNKSVRWLYPKWIADIILP